MQGVRSTRGCTSCRRRKKGCDFQRPTCGRCQHLNVICRYEDRQFTFVANSRRSPSHSPPHSDLATALQPAFALALPSNSPLTATDIDMQVNAAFWNVYLPREDVMLDGSIDNVDAAPWVPTVRALAEVNSHVRTALASVVYAGLGWWREDASLVQHGLRLYAQAIRETNQMLRDPVEALSDAALALCRTLSLFEMFRRGPGAPDTGSSQVADWRSHAEGTFRLVQLRGLDKHTSGDGYKLYDGVRMAAVIFGISRRQPNTFTSLSWDLLNRKTLRDDLFDSMSFLPDLLQQYEQFGTYRSQNPGTENQEQRVLQGNELIQRGVNLCLGLRAWELRASRLCEAAASSPGTDLRAENLDFIKQNLCLFPVCKMHGYGFFFLCTQYWAMCVKVHTAVQNMQNRIQNLVHGLELNIPATHIPNWVNPDLYAHHIADTAAHYFDTNAGLWAAMSAIFPVGTALLYFAQSGQHDSDAFQKMDAAFSNTKSGAIMRDFLRSTGFYARRENRSPG